MAPNNSPIGAPVVRAEGPDKVTGRALYAADVVLPGMLWGKVLRSPHPHARIVSVDASRARKVEGVRAVITGKEIPGHLVGRRLRALVLGGGFRRGRRREGAASRWAADLR